MSPTSDPRTSLLGRAARGIWSSAWTLLTLTNLFWAGNIIIGRAVAGQVPPIALAYWRWTGAFVIALAFTWPRVQRDWPILRRRWPMLLLLAATGIASYNTMSYIGLQYTTALNVLLLQSAMPMVILLWVFVLFGEYPSRWQTLGLLLSLFGVVVIVTHGALGSLAHLSANVGDIWVLGALVIYALYPPLLRRAPKADPLSFLVVLMGIGSLMMLPFYVWEIGRGAAIHGGWTSYAAMAYTAVFPSLIAYLFFNRGVELIGAGRAGQSAHLMPVFGTILAVLCLGERFYLHHAVGIAAIAAGLLLASRRTAGSPTVSPPVRIPAGTD